MRTHNERSGKFPAHDGEAFAEIEGRALEQELVGGSVSGRAITALPKESAIEKEWRGGHRTGVSFN